MLTPVLWCLAAAALFGASTPAAKVLLGEDIGPFTLAGLLYLGAGLATLPFAFKGGSSARRRDTANLRRLLGAVVFGGVLGPVALMLGLRAAPSASVALLLNLETTATALLAWALFKEHLDARTWVANGLVVISGVALAAPEDFTMAPAAGLWCWPASAGGWTTTSPRSSTATRRSRRRWSRGWSPAGSTWAWA